jgi:1,4-alpha-glucan branching enzyme
VEWSERGPWAVLSATTPAFAWSDQAYRTPALRDLVIYELCIRDFVGYWQAHQPHYGTLDELTNYVAYLVELGVNAVELMPIQAFPGASSWGYNPVFYFAIANTYGEPLDLKRFVNECHAQGIAVILDVAFNHAWGEHPYYRFYPPMYAPNGEPLADWNPFFHHTPGTVNMWGGLDWDHFVPETTHYFQDVVRFWLQEYHVDGFRFDWAAGVDYDSRDPMQPGFNPYHGLSAIAWAARQAKPDCLLLAEYWPLEGTHPDKTAAKLVNETPINGCWNGHFHHTLDYVLNQRWQWEKQDIFNALAGFRSDGFVSADQLVNYTCSHDEVRPEHEIKFYSWGYMERPSGLDVQASALAKAALGLITLFSVPGTPMIYAGQEYGEDGARTIDFQPLHWGKLMQKAHIRHKQLVMRLIQARHQYPALRSDNLEFYVNDFPSEQLVRFKRWATENDFVNVALNFGIHERTVSLDFPQDGAWRDVVSAQLYQVTNGQLTITLAGWSGMILVPNCN